MRVPVIVRPRLNCSHYSGYAMGGGNAIEKARSSMRSARRVISAREATPLPSIEGAKFFQTLLEPLQSLGPTIVDICESRHAGEYPLALLLRTYR